jgi:hypothetical protein
MEGAGRGSWRPPILVYPRWLGRIPDYPQRVRRYVVEEIVQVRASERNTSDILSRVGYEYSEVGVQGPEQLLQMVSTAVEVVGVRAGIDWVGDIPGEGGVRLGEVMEKLSRCGFRLCLRKKSRHGPASSRTNRRAQKRCGDLSSWL